MLRILSRNSSGQVTVQAPCIDPWLHEIAFSEGARIEHENDIQIGSGCAADMLVSPDAS